MNIATALINFRPVNKKTNLNFAFNILIIFCCKACKRLKKLSQLSYVASLFFVFNIFKSERLRSELELRENLEEIWVYKILFFELFIVIVKDKMKYPLE